MFRRAATARWKTLALGTAVFATGCRNAHEGGPRPFQTRTQVVTSSGTVAEVVPDFPLPKELNKASLPAYTVEAPDVLVIAAQRLVPLPPYKIEPADSLYLFAPGAPEREPINGLYPVEPDGTINVGPTYGGRVKVADLTVPEVEAAVGEMLKPHLRDPAVRASLAQSRSVEPVGGEHRVRPDGTVGLGSYGSVYVAGLTVPQVKAAVEQHLSRALYKPEVSVEVQGFHSKHYYVITDGPAGEQVARLLSTGNETVLDAVAQAGGTPGPSAKRVWVARPAPVGVGDQILPVDWVGITRQGQTRTNYQIMPGDRVFVMSQPGPTPTVAAYFGRFGAPVERAMCAVAQAAGGEPAVVPMSDRNPAYSGGPIVVRGE